MWSDPWSHTTYRPNDGGQATASRWTLARVAWVNAGPTTVDECAHSRLQPAAVMVSSRGADCSVVTGARRAPQMLPI
jgi:hypothetical protein